MDLYDEIYYSLTGELVTERVLPWVPNAFAIGSPCEVSYGKLMDARDRILEKLGVEEDPDLEVMLQEMDLLQKCLCRKVMELRHM